MQWRDIVIFPAKTSSFELFSEEVNCEFLPRPGSKLKGFEM